MKTMKKSKVIVPALGLLLLSTAASVSGTVAWFSANTVYNTSISSISVANLEGSLSCTLLKGVGTVVDGSSIVLKDNVSNGNASWLGDASFDHTSTNLYNDTAVENNYENLGTLAAAETAEAATVGSSKWFVSLDTTNSRRYYRAVSWTMKFAFNFQGDTTPMNLYFDTTSTASATTHTNAQNSSTAETGKGFRLAFLPEVAGDAFVWAPNQTIGNCNYVASTSALKDATNTAGSYAAYTTDLVASNTAAENKLLNTATSGNATPYNYLGQFVYDSAANPDELEVKCVAWFEGTDPNVVTDAALQTVVANLKFFAVKHAA